MSREQTQLRFASNQRDGVLDMICKEDVNIPAHAEVALISLSCQPVNHSIVVEPTNNGMHLSFWGGDVPRLVAFPSGRLSSTNIAAGLKLAGRSMIRTLQYATDIGLAPTFSLDRDSKIEFNLNRYFDIGGRTVAATNKRNVVNDQSVQDFHRAATGGDGETFISSKVPVAATAFTFVRAMVPDVSATSGKLFIGFSYNPLTSSTTTTKADHWGFGVLIYKLKVWVIEDGQVVGPALGYPVQQDDLIEVRRKGAHMKAYIYTTAGETLFMNPEGLTTGGYLATTYALYDMWTGDVATEIDCKVTDARFVCGDITQKGTPVVNYPSLGYACKSVNRDQATNIRLIFRSLDLARFLGFTRLDYGPFSAIQYRLLAENPHASYLALGSVIVTCDQPFNLSSYNVVDMGDRAPNGRVSILATVTPPTPLDGAPIVWDSAPVWVPVHNRDKIMARRFVFRLMTGDFTPIDMMGETVLNVLVRASGKCADGHPDAKRPHMM